MKAIQPNMPFYLRRGIASHRSIVSLLMLAFIAMHYSARIDFFTKTKPSCLNSHKDVNLTIAPLSLHAKIGSFDFVFGSKTVLYTIEFSNGGDTKPPSTADQLRTLQQP